MMIISLENSLLGAIWSRDSLMAMLPRSTLPAFMSTCQGMTFLGTTLRGCEKLLDAPTTTCWALDSRVLVGTN